MGKCFDENYWDCDCYDNYIHSKTIKVCKICETTQEESPDSVVDEVIRYKRELIENIRRIGFESELIDMFTVEQTADKNHMTSAEYCKHSGALCPYCRSADIDVLDTFETQDSITYQPIKCNKCGKCWVDIRGLVSYEEAETKNV